MTSNLFYSLSKESKINRCEEHKKCPCRTWINCNYYIDIDSQQKRLKRKMLKDKTSNSIKEWYDTRFREDFYIHNLYCSG